MIPHSRPARQPVHKVWSMERLIHERAVALGNDIDKTTLGNYGSALNSYISFTTSHNLPAEPTSDTLLLYIVYMSHYINPCSVTTYLAGITQQLELYFPSVRDARKSTLICCTLRGCLQEHSTPTV